MANDNFRERFEQERKSFESVLQDIHEYTSNYDQESISQIFSLIKGFKSDVELFFSEVYKESIDSKDNVRFQQERAAVRDLPETVEELSIKFGSSYRNILDAVFEPGDDSQFEVASADSCGSSTPPTDLIPAVTSADEVEVKLSQLLVDRGCSQQAAQHNEGEGSVIEEGAALQMRS